MGIPRPKILTAITVPTGGWVMKWYLSDAAQYDTAKTATIAAGTYFMAGDNQSDCFLFELVTKMHAQHTGNFSSVDLIIDIAEDTHKVEIKFDSLTDATPPLNDVKLAWTEEDGASIAAVLGFDSSADDAITADDHPVFTADWQHGYGWYANEDGLLESLMVEDASEVRSLQSRAISGKVKTQRMSAGLYKNELRLQFVKRARMFSRQVGYGTANVQPYERNEGLECWWQDARGGTEFRVYRDGRQTPNTQALVNGNSTGATTTTLTDSGRSWDIDPQKYKGMILRKPTFSQNATHVGQSFYISSHTATVVTVANAHPSGLLVSQGAAIAYEIYDLTYQTYVVDLQNMSEFVPEEIPQIDRYNITIPLLRYV